MNSAAVEVCVLANLPWDCSDPVVGASRGQALDCVNCAPGPASISTHSDCVLLVIRTRLLPEITSNGKTEKGIAVSPAESPCRVLRPTESTRLPEQRSLRHSLQSGLLL